MKPQRHQREPTETVRSIYRKLSRRWGPQHWWPAETAFEVVVGAILTQNTSWTNVEKAIANLREADALNIEAIRRLPIGELEQLIRSSGYFRQKAARLREFVVFLDGNYGGSLAAMLAAPTLRLREQLLEQKGIGPETADSILLYAGQEPIFVVDAYTRRVLERHDAVARSAKYDEVRELVEGALQREKPLPAPDGKALAADRPAIHSPSAMSTMARPATVQVFNEMHGVLVQLGKHYCSKRGPNCDACPLGEMLSHPIVEEPPVKRDRPVKTKRRAAAVQLSRKSRV